MFPAHPIPPRFVTLITAISLVHCLHPPVLQPLPERRPCVCTADRCIPNIWHSAGHTVRVQQAVELKWKNNISINTMQIIPLVSRWTLGEQ